MENLKETTIVQHIKMEKKSSVCDECKYFNQTQAKIGECRRRAPFLSGWPIVEKTDWCGEFQSREESFIHVE